MPASAYDSKVRARCASPAPLATLAMGKPAPISAICQPISINTTCPKLPARMDQRRRPALSSTEWAYNKLVCKPKAPKSTGGRDGLYFIPMAPPDQQNMMEDKFWKRIDQWGADGLALLWSNDPAAAAKMNKVGWTKFIMSLLFRNPNGVKNFNTWATGSVLNGCLKDDYAKYRLPHEPASFDKFQDALEQPGMTELAARSLRYMVENEEICRAILDMEWQVVTVPPTSDPILTSDVPLIINGALKDDDGCLILPLSPTSSSLLTISADRHEADDQRVGRYR